MVLSADSLGIRKGLNPLFCGICGCRVAWASDDCDTDNLLIECEDCAKEDRD